MILGTLKSVTSAEDDPVAWRRSEDIASTAAAGLFLEAAMACNKAL